jgi:NADPH-dependent 2,4-dienoyl-CoA reductase/sulfur reductase-like enzyme
VTLTDGRRTWSVPCDYLACGFHLVPNLELPQLLGCTLANGSVKVDGLQETSITNVFCAGEPTGIGGVESALVEGEIAGLAAAGRADTARQLAIRRRRWLRFKALLAQAFELTPQLRRLAGEQTIFCRCEDIRYGDIAGFGSWRDAKLQTRCGMGACQGRTCGTAARFLFGWDPASVRPPIFPVRTSSLTLAGTFGTGQHHSNSSQKS